jgi:hypothetical protein
VFATLVDAVDEDVDRRLDDPVRIELAGPRAAQHVSQGTE